MAQKSFCRLSFSTMDFMIDFVGWGRDRRGNILMMDVKTFVHDDFEFWKWKQAASLEFLDFKTIFEEIFDVKSEGLTIDSVLEYSSLFSNLMHHDFSISLKFFYIKTCVTTKWHVDAKSVGNITKIRRCTRLVTYFRPNPRFS